MAAVPFSRILKNGRKASVIGLILGFSLVDDHAPRVLLFLVQAAFAARQLRQQHELLLAGNG